MLEELGEDVSTLRKKKLKFKELEKLYYKRLDEKLREVWNYHANRTPIA